MTTPSQLQVLASRAAAPTSSAGAATPRRRRPPEVTIRLARRRDAGALRRLAELDERRLPDGAHLLAIVDGQPVAALALADGSVAADPFEATRGAVELLRLRARQLGATAAVPRLTLLERLAIR